jgi:hypothetical protein
MSGVEGFELRVEVLEFRCFSLSDTHLDAAVEGYLADKKHPPPRNLQKDHT